MRKGVEQAHMGEREMGGKGMEELVRVGERRQGWTGRREKARDWPGVCGGFGWHKEEAP
jgi:hypothetical protein